MKASLKSTILAGFGIAALALAVPVGIAQAQGGFQRGGAQGGAPMPGQGGPGGPGMQMRGGGGGGVAMTQDQNFLYVVQGPQVFKLNKRDLSVVAAGRLPMGGGGPGAGGGRRDGDAGPRRGGGGQSDVPPPTE